MLDKANRDLDGKQGSGGCVKVMAVMVRTTESTRPVIQMTT